MSSRSSGSLRGTHLSIAGRTVNARMGGSSSLPLNHSVVAAVDGDLGAGGCAKCGAAEFDDDTGYGAACDLGSEHVVAFIVVDRQTVAGGSLLEDFGGP